MKSFYKKFHNYFHDLLFQFGNINVTHQFPKRVIFADGYTRFSAAGTFPEKAGRTETYTNTIQTF